MEENTNVYITKSTYKRLLSAIDREAINSKLEKIDIIKIKDYKFDYLNRGQIFEILLSKFIFSNKESIIGYIKQNKSTRNDDKIYL